VEEEEEGEIALANCHPEKLDQTSSAQERKTKRRAATKTDVQVINKLLIKMID